MLCNCNVGTASFTVTVSDYEAPVVTVPENIAVNAAAGSDTATVSFTAPTATDAVDGTINPVLVSSPTVGQASGSLFPIGVTTLTYTATDVVGNVGTASFTVTVSDNEAPVVTVPENIAVNAAAGSNTAIVDFTAPTAIDAVDGAITDVPGSSSPAGLASGSLFPIGVTTLT
jgi:ACT domain-containing protein